MAFSQSPAKWPADTGAAEPRFTDLFTDGDADIHLFGVPYDVSVLGRKGARDGPMGIRQAMRFLACHDPDSGADLSGLRIKDHGDVTGLREDVLAAHGVVREAAAGVLQDRRPTVILGGDHGLTYAHIGALADTVEGNIGIVVIDAHYDLRSYEGQPSSGTPFKRILTELDGRVRGRNIAEIGIRPYANAPSLSHYAADQDVYVYTMGDVRRDGIQAVTQAALEAAGDDVDHLWLSIDIDGLDQSIASGCSAPGAGGLWFHEAAHVTRAVARDPRCRGMDLLEVAPSLDPTGNTVRTAAQLVAAFCGASAGQRQK